MHNNDYKIDWKRKLTSRKFWMATVSFVTMLAVFLGCDENTATQLGSLIMAGGTVIAYIIGEGMADAAGAGTELEIIQETSLEEK